MRTHHTREEMKFIIRMIKVAEKEMKDNTEKEKKK